MEIQAVCRVHAGGFEQLFTDGAAQLVHLALQTPTGNVQDLTDQGVAVGVNAGGCHSNQRVALTHALGAEQFVRLDQTGCCARNVVLVLCEQAGVLSGFAASQGGASLCTCASDTAHNVQRYVREH